MVQINFLAQCTPWMGIKLNTQKKIYAATRMHKRSSYCVRRSFSVVSKTKQITVSLKLETFNLSRMQMRSRRGTAWRQFPVQIKRFRHSISKKGRKIYTLLSPIFTFQSDSFIGFFPCSKNILQHWKCVSYIFWPFFLPHGKKNVNQMRANNNKCILIIIEFGTPLTLPYTIIVDISSIFFPFPNACHSIIRNVENVYTMFMWRKRNDNDVTTSETGWTVEISKGFQQLAFAKQWMTIKQNQRMAWL